MLQFARKRYKIKDRIRDIGRHNTCAWEKVSQKTANHADKLAAWRNIIELRRAHRQCSTDVCIKALSSTKGDVAKAITLLGSREFSYEAHFGTGIDEDLKESLNPYKSGALREESAEMIQRYQRSLANAGSTGSQGIRRAHKHLQQTLATSALLTRSAYDLESILLQSYYSKCGVVQSKGKMKSRGRQIS
jgi:hypothetical protein